MINCVFVIYSEPNIDNNMLFILSLLLFMTIRNKSTLLRTGEIIEKIDQDISKFKVMRKKHIPNENFKF